MCLSEYHPQKVDKNTIVDEFVDYGKSTDNENSSTPNLKS